MRNLCLSDFKSHNLRFLTNCETLSYYQHCLYACGKGKIIKCHGDSKEIICDLTNNLYPVTEVDDIPKALDITYCCEKNLLYLILLNGDIISINPSGGGSEDIIGSVDGGIEAAQWSPEQEVIALVTGNQTVIVMTNDFDPISEVNLHGGGFGEKQFITVGWGKKETQFRGSEGKFNAKEKKKPEVPLDKNNKIKISWRGDAEYFVVSSINPETSERYLRVFSKNGVLQYTSEDLDGLEHCLDWRPSGSLIASTQVLPNKYNVCFFEKNGLKHGEFTLPLSRQQIKVEDVFWNKDSKLLALFITKLSGDNGGDKEKYIQLYTVSNYHWYCKYTINFGCSAEPLFVQWSVEKFNNLHVILKKGEEIFHNNYSWLWTVNKSKGNNPEDESLVAVINGCDLKITSFKRGIVPPPLSTYQLQMPEPINSVSFAPGVDSDLLSSNDFLVHLSDGTVLGYKFVNSKGIGHELLFKIDKLWDDFESGYNVQWVSSKTLMFCLVKSEEGCSKPYLSLIFVNDFDQLETTYEKKEILLQSTISILKASQNAVVFHDNIGQLYLFNKNEDEFRVFDPNKKTITDLDVHDKDGFNVNVFALDNVNRFYVNNKLVCNGVLSFHVHEKFVLLTTMKHELLCLNTDNDLEEKDISETCSRRVERGSRIITSVQKDMKVILQMPRGNLECVQPRALSLLVLGKYLGSLKYYEAFDLMRKQRINLNLIYDHNPNLFSKNIDTFIDQIKDLQWMTLFLSDLSDEDVTRTMYGGFYKGRNNVSGCEGEKKINIVCDKIEKALTQKQDSDKYLLPILTCYIKKGEIEFLETALLKLKQLKEKESKGIKPAVSFNEAFRYILYLIDVDELYKIALGMYDFDLVLMVASNSQKDPKEYLSFLNELKKLEPHYQKFTIDKYLKRHKKALTHLLRCEGEESFNECINFIKAHKLYKFALKLIPENSERYKQVCLCYGDELMNSDSYEEAGIMYSNAGLYKKAMEAYRKSGNWEEAISCGRELHLTGSELEELYLDLAVELSELKRFKEAAVIYLDYLKDVEECLRTLCRGKLFGEAYRISNLHNRSDLQNVIASAIEDQGDLVQGQITYLREIFTKYRDRLQVVRKQKAEASESCADFEDDLYSDANTIITQSNATSRNTNRTYRSAKNRRKHERKLLSLKEGSQYEDLALITALHGVVTNTVELRSEVKELNKFLIKIKRYEPAEKLQTDLKDLLRTIEHSKSDIWTSDLLRHSYGPEATSNEISAMFRASGSVVPVSLPPKFAIAPETQSNVKWEMELLHPS